MSVSIDWGNLGFSYTQTACHIRYVWRDGTWSGGDLVEDPYLSVHVAATGLHYGQSGFEGLKAFKGQDGRVRIFRPDANGERLVRTAQRVCMPEIPVQMFKDACLRIVEANLDYVPPYESDGALYIRPLLFGSGARIGLQPADEYTFIVMVVPVGAYYKSGLKPVRAVVVEDFDRAAPHGVGHVKVAGNYAAGMIPHEQAVAKGFPMELYLDAAEHRYVEEFGTSNFIAITQDNRYVTAKSPSILPSITNLSLQQLAVDRGMACEARPIPFEEVGSFTEVGACGTAVVLTPVYEIHRGETILSFGGADVCGPQLQELYDAIRAIQRGDAEDLHEWNLVL
jgi:branched-chain amino acid aminotransferase